MSILLDESKEKSNPLFNSNVLRDNSVLKNLVIRGVSGDDERKTVLPIELTPEFLDISLKKKLRWVMLFLACFFVVGNYFCYDYPALLKD
jgi:hypothetical protein